MDKDDRVRNAVRFLTPASRFPTLDSKHAKEVAAMRHAPPPSAEAQR